MLSNRGDSAPSRDEHAVDGPYSTTRTSIGTELPPQSTFSAIQPRTEKSCVKFGKSYACKVPSCAIHHAFLSQMFLTSLAWKKQEASENNASPGWSLSFVLGISSDRGSRGCISISHLDSSTSLSHLDLTFQCLAYYLRRVPSYCVELHVLTLLPFPRNLPLVSPSFSRFSGGPRPPPLRKGTSSFSTRVCFISSSYSVNRH